MKRLIFLFFTIFTISLANDKYSFKKFGCEEIKVGQSKSFSKGVDCVVIKDSKELAYWVKIKILPFNTGNPEYDKILNSFPRPLNYIGCDNYKDLFSNESGQFTKEDFQDVEVNVNDEIWYLVVAPRDIDFCYLTGGGALRIETIFLEHQNDANSMRDSSKKFPVNIDINKKYFGFSANDFDYYTINLPKNRLIKFKISYKDGPKGPRKLYYGISSKYENNIFRYCTSSHKTIEAFFRGGSENWKKAFFPKVGETAYCFLNYKKEKDNESDFIKIYLFIKPPLQYPPPDAPIKEKSDFKIPRYKLSFEIIK